MDRALRARAADRLHGRPLRRRLGASTTRRPSPRRRRRAYELFSGLKKVARTRNVLLPVGGDYAPPCRWVTSIHRDWNERYVWPRFVCGDPAGLLRRRARRAGRRGAQAPSPQTRDMNPVYTGKDVSYIDTKQAQRTARRSLADAEAWRRSPRCSPGRLSRRGARQGLAAAGLRRPPRRDHRLRVRPGLHRPADRLAGGVRPRRDRARRRAPRRSRRPGRPRRTRRRPGRPQLASTWQRPGRADRRRLRRPGAARRRTTGAALPAVRRATDGRTAVSSCRRCRRWAHGTPRSLQGRHAGLEPAADGPGHPQRVLRGDGRPRARRRRQQPRSPTGGRRPGAAAHRRHRQRARSYRRSTRRTRASARGPGTSRRPGPGRPRRTPPTASSRARPLGGGSRSPWRGRRRSSVHAAADPVDGRRPARRSTHPSTATTAPTGWSGCAGPSDVPGGLPVQRGGGRGRRPRVRVRRGGQRAGPVDAGQPGQHLVRAGLHRPGRRCTTSPASSSATAPIGVAEWSYPTGTSRRTGARTGRRAGPRGRHRATSTIAGGPRYGDLEVDSNLPDIRIVLGGRGRQPVVAEARAAARSLRPATALRAGARRVRPLARGLAAQRGPARRPRACRCSSSRGPVAAAVAATTRPARSTARLAGRRDVEDVTTDGGAAHLRPAGFAVDPTGALHLSLLRSCTGWPSGVWIDPPRRTTPDGSSFQLQHWTHEFHYALVSDSWGLARGIPPGSWTGIQHAAPRGPVRFVGR